MTAAMPLAVARAQGAPSSAAMRASNIDTVGLAIARIGEAVGLALEAGFRLLGRLIGVAGGHEQRFGGLLEGRAHLPAAHGLGARAPFARFFVRGHDGLLRALPGRVKFLKVRPANTGPDFRT